MIYKFEIPTKDWETWQMLSKNEDEEIFTASMQKHVFTHAKNILVLSGDTSEIRTMRCELDTKLSKHFLHCTTKKPKPQAYKLRKVKRGKR